MITFIITRLNKARTWRVANPALADSRKVKRLTAILNWMVMHRLATIVLLPGAPHKIYIPRRAPDMSKPPMTVYVPQKIQEDLLTTIPFNEWCRSLTDYQQEDKESDG